MDYTNLRSGLEVKAWGQYLAEHKDKDYEEWSAGLAVRLDPGMRGRGAVFTLEPEWNEAGHSQRIRVDLTKAWRDMGWGMGWRVPPGLRLELVANRRERGDAPTDYGIDANLSFQF